MDETQIELFREFKLLRQLFLANSHNPQIVAQIDQRISELTVSAIDSGRVLAKQYEWVVPYESGFIHVDTKSYIECEILYRGHYAPQIVDTIKALLSPGAVAIDVGANIGCMMLPMAWQVGPTGRVIAFEPEPECFGRLKKNMLMNRLSQVSLYQLAISNDDSTHTLYLKAENAANRAGASLKQGEDFPRKVDIQTSRVDSIRELGELTRCDLIKIDTEGHELIVLKQMKDIISRFQPHIIFEYEETTWRLHGQSYQEAASMMEDLGYTLYAMAEGMLVPLSPKTPFGRDIVCVPAKLRR